MPRTSAGGRSNATWGVLAIEICDAVGTQSKFWRIADGDDIKARSETMHNKTDAVATATHFKENTAAYTFEVTSTRDANYPYSWHATRNGLIVVSSTEMYKLWVGADQGMEFIRANVRWAPIVDLTVKVGGRW